MKLNNRIYILDILRIISAIWVVVVHTIAWWLHSFSLWSIQWRIVNMIEGFWHRSVPVFLMLTGIFLLRDDKLDEDPLIFYQTRLTKVIVPFIICVFAFLWFDYFVVWKSIDIYHIFSNFINVWYSYHLRYILIIIWLYIIIPFMRILVKYDKDHKDIKEWSVRILYLYIYIRIWFKIINQILINIIGVPWAATSSWFLWYDGLVIIWYCIRYDKFIINKIWLRWSILLYFIAAIFTVLATGALSIYSWSMNDLFYQNNTPNVLAMSIALICIARYFYDNLNLPDRYIYIIRKLSKTSFGVYLYHPIFIYIYDLIFHELWISYWYNLILTATFSVISVRSFVHIIQKTSIWKKILPET